MVVLVLFILTLSLAFASESVPQLPLAFSANITSKGFFGQKFNGSIHYDYTKLSFKIQVSGKALGSEVFNNELYRYDITPPIQYTQSTVESCKKQKPDLPQCMSLSIQPGAKFVGWEPIGDVASAAHWTKDNFLNTVDWWIVNTTSGLKVDWKLVHYKLKARILGTIFDYGFSNIQVGLQPETVFTPFEGCPPIVPPVFYRVAGYVKSAVSNQPIPGMTVKISGKTTNQTVTNSDGVYTFANVNPGDNKIAATNNKQYADSSVSLNVTGDIQAGGLGDIFVSPSLPADKMRIVLSWGFMPQDLDAHTWDGGCEIYYGNKQCPQGQLDHDCQTGYGPETTTLSLSPSPANPSSFHFFVAQYSSQGSLATSSARVVVYVGNTKTQDWTVPTSGSGMYWNVASFDATTGAVIETFNVIQQNKPTTN